MAFLTGLSYAELATALPEAGAEFVYMREALPGGPWVSTAVGIVIMLYILVGLAPVALIAPEELEASASPLATAVGPGRPVAARALGAVALFATANTALAGSLLLLPFGRVAFVGGLASLRRWLRSPP